MMTSVACGSRTLALIVSPKSPLCVMDSIENAQKKPRCQKCCDCASPCTTGTVVNVAVDIFKFIFTPSEGWSAY